MAINKILTNDLAVNVSKGQQLVDLTNETKEVTNNVVDKVNALFVNTVADLRLLTGLQDGDVIYLKGHTQIGIGGGNIVVKGDRTSEVDDGFNTFVVDGKVLLRSPRSETIDLSVYGVSEGQNLNSLLTSLIPTFKEILIPVNTFALDTVSDFDLQGTTLRSIVNGSTITAGNTKNGKLVDVYKRTKPNFKSIKTPASHPVSKDYKLLIRRYNQAAFVVQETEGGYIRHVIQDGVLTNTDSAGAPAELIRSTNVDLFHEVYVGNAIADLLSGSVVDYPSTFGGTFYRALSRLGQIATKSFDKGNGAVWYQLKAQNSYVEYTNVDSMNGKIRLTFLSSSTFNNTGIQVSIDGAIISIGDFYATYASSGIVNIDVPVNNNETSGSDTHTVRITNIDPNNTPFNFAGCNIYKLSELDSPLPNANWYAAFSLDGSYVSNRGASDYAIFDTDAGQWVGSYHGGETRTSLRVQVDGSIYDYENASFDTFIMGRQIRINQRTNIANKLSTYQYLDFVSFGGYSIQVTMKGNINCSDFYTCMSTTDIPFRFVEYPSLLETTANSVKYDVGNNDNVVIQYAPTSEVGVGGRRVINEFTFFESSEFKFNGAYVLRSDGNYNKLYYGPVANGQANVTEIAFKVNKQFL